MHVGEARLQALFDVNLCLEEVAPVLRQLSQAGGGHLHLLVFEQAAHQLGARVFGLFAFGLLLGRQQHARLDLDEHCRHQQILGGQLQVAAADLVHIRQVLLGHPHHGDVEDVEVLLADQVQQQIQRAFKGLEEDFKRVGWDVQVLRQRKQRLAVQASQGHLIHHVGHGAASGFRLVVGGCAGGRCVAHVCYEINSCWRLLVKR